MSIDFLSRSPLVSLSPDNFFLCNEEECKLLVTSLYNPISYQRYTFLENEYTDDVCIVQPRVGEVDKSIFREIFRHLIVILKTLGKIIKLQGMQAGL